MIACLIIEEERYGRKLDHRRLNSAELYLDGSTNIKIDDPQRMNGCWIARLKLINMVEQVGLILISTECSGEYLQPYEEAEGQRRVTIYKHFFRVPEYLDVEKIKLE